MHRRGMDGTIPPPTDHAEGLYARRAAALLAARAELFNDARSRSFSASVAAAPERRESRGRASGRQLTLPLPRERRARRARMLG
jgi:hypothetical protein